MKRFAILILLLCGLQAKAQIDTDRPDQTESARAMNPGDLQLESGVQVTYLGDNFPSIRVGLLPTLQFRYGIAKGFELRMLSQYATIQNMSSNVKYNGMADFELGSKIQFYSSDNFNILLLTHLVMPTGSAEVTSDMWGITNRICAGWDFSEGQSLGVNLGYNYYEQNEFSGIVFTLAYAKSVSDKVGFYIEPFGFVNNDDFVLNFDAGMVYLPTPQMQLDISFGMGVNERMNYLSIGSSWLFSKNSD